MVDICRAEWPQFVRSGKVNQGSTLRPVGSPMRMQDLVCWRLTFLVWSPIWLATAISSYYSILFLFTFSFPRIHDEMNKY